MRNGRPSVIVLAAALLVPGPRLTGAQTPPAAAPPQVVKFPPPALVWDAEGKEITAKEGETNVVFTFSVTNVSPNEVEIQQVQTSCGCSVAKMPSQPWKLAPGAHDDLEVNVDVRGKHGVLIKNVLITSTAGFKVLQTRVNLPELPATHRAMSNLDDRVKNIHVAMADRQAIFKNDCARCHAEPARGKGGQALYYAVCAICHEAAHRASMVPNLATLPHPTDREHWETWVRDGKPGTLIPGFRIICSSAFPAARRRRPHHRPDNE
jgi:cytochrome c5